MKNIKSVQDLTPDFDNANLGSERGTKVIDNSLEQHGAGRAIVVDKYGFVIAGNKTLELAAARGFPIRVVQTDGKTLVAVQRTDLDLQDPKARQLAYLDNRAHEVSLTWSADQIGKDLSAGIQLGGMFTTEELDSVLASITVLEHGVTIDIPAADQPRWEAFVERLAAKYPDAPRLSDIGGGVSGALIDLWVMESLMWFSEQEEQDDAD